MVRVLWGAPLPLLQKGAAPVADQDGAGLGLRHGQAREAHRVRRGALDGVHGGRHWFRTLWASLLLQSARRHSLPLCPQFIECAASDQPLLPFYACQPATPTPANAAGSGGRSGSGRGSGRRAGHHLPHARDTVAIAGAYWGGDCPCPCGWLQQGAGPVQAQQPSHLYGGWLASAAQISQCILGSRNMN